MPQQEEEKPILPTGNQIPRTRKCLKKEKTEQISTSGIRNLMGRPCTADETGLHPALPVSEVKIADLLSA